MQAQEVGQSGTPNLIDAGQLARNLAIKKATIRAWTRLTEIPRINCGRLVRYDYAAVLEWLRAQRKPEARAAEPRSKRRSKRRRRIAPASSADGSRGNPRAA